MPGSGRSHKNEKQKGLLDKAKDLLAKREKKDDPQSRTGVGGRRRARDIDEYVSGAQSGKKK